MNQIVNKILLAKKVLTKGIWSPNATILMYHRVEDIQPDPWLLSVSPDNFRQQIEVLKQYEIITMQQLTKKLKDNQITRSIVITFDDGYKDNLYNAAPILEEAGLPATIFVSSGFTGTGKQFWSNDLDSIFLSPGELPAQLDIHTKTIQFSFDLGKDKLITKEQLDQYRHWIAWEPPPTLRHTLYVKIEKLIKSLPLTEQEALIARLYQWSGKDRAVFPKNLMMDETELKDLSSRSLFEIGGHTVTHPELIALSPADQKREIIENKAALEEILGKTVRGMAYPYGAYNADSTQAAEKAGLLYACTTKQQPLDKNSSLFELPRLRVRNWNGTEFKKRMGRWMKLGI